MDERSIQTSGLCVGHRNIIVVPDAKPRIVSEHPIFMSVDKKSILHSLDTTSGSEAVPPTFWGRLWRWVWGKEREGGVV